MHDIVKEELRKEELRIILVKYVEYEQELADKEIENGAPPPIQSHRFSFSRFYNWLNHIRNE